MTNHQFDEQNHKSAATSGGTENTPQNVNPGRRKLTRLGVGVPVILTLSSRSVLAGQCLSNILSGNLSDPNRDSICGKGWSPGGWGLPGGEVGGVQTRAAWLEIGFTYGTLKTSAECSTKPNRLACYEGGATINTLGSFAGASFLNVNGVDGSVPLRDVLSSGSEYKPTRHLIAAYFNARLSEVRGTVNGRYSLSSQEVIDLAKGLWTPPGGLSIEAFLDTTWAGI